MKCAMTAPIVRGGYSVSLQKHLEVCVLFDAMSSLVPLRCIALRLKPGQELQEALLSCVSKQKLRAAFVITCVGSVLRATLRMANSETVTSFEGPFEIVSLVGTLSGGHGHLHICLSDKDGKVIGGHVIGDLDIYTTAEIVLGECENTSFLREYDSDTGYDELVVVCDNEKPTP